MQNFARVHAASVQLGQRIMAMIDLVVFYLSGL